VLVVSSDLGELVSLSDRIAVVSDGQVRMQAPRSEIAMKSSIHRLVRSSQG